ncbi:AAA family ATPase [Halopseudomonas salina]|uniref:Cell division protein n=1 Tax=Halopseudomonas salina TaxID=1323744 RepID=A0ABQ1P582_9GAMM|nr:AAA family ATPase [Halopseudomonas salina]GGC91424.1 cell division protein [Halopseudomonas salina]
MNALSGAESIEEYYQLSHDPFAARTPGFKFFTPQRKTVLAQLHHLARFGDQVLLVTGPQGSGKTLLRQVLVASSNKDTTQCVVTTAREFPSASALTSFFCQAVNASGRDSRSLLLRAGQLNDTGVNLYLIIDDAHLLEQDALQELVDLSRVSGGDSPLRIFLFADDSIQPMLDSVSADEEGAEWLHLIALQPYTLDETRDYLAQRLEAAGQGIELLDEDQTQWIHRHSGGWPGRINDAARQSMGEAMAEQESPITSRRAVLPLKSLVAVVLVAVGIGFAWFMGEREGEPVTTVLELPDPVVPVDATNDPQLAELTELNAAPGLAPSERPPGSDELAEVPSDNEDTRIADSERSATVNLFPSNGAGEVPVEASAEAQVERSEQSPAMPAQPVQPVPESPVVDAPTPTSEAQPVQPAREPVAPSAPQTAAAGASGDDWYRAQQPGRYVLQVLGSRSRGAASGFISNNPGVAELRFFQTTHQGEPWFVVTQGNYAGRQQAQQGISGLPASMRSANPWPRSVGDIQKALK